MGNGDCFEDNPRFFMINLFTWDETSGLCDRLTDREDSVPCTSSPECCIKVYKKELFRRSIIFSLHFIYFIKILQEEDTEPIYD